MPRPEKLIENTPEARKAAQKEKHRPGFEDIVWFRMDIGRRQNADPRWILPILCRRGHITRNEIGAIRISDSETYFQVPRQAAEKFAAALDRTANIEGEEESGIVIEASANGPRETGRRNRKNSGKRAGSPAHHKPRPHGKGSGKGPYRGSKKAERKKKPGGGPRAS